MKVYCYDCGLYRDIGHHCGLRRCYKCRRHLPIEQAQSHIDSCDFSHPKFDLGCWVWFKCIFDNMKIKL